MAKRTQKQIELDCKKIQEAAKTATSMKELETATGLSLSQIKTSLSNHPRISKKIQKQLEENKSKKEEECTNSLDEQRTESDEKPEVKQGSDFDYEYGYVVDTSMIEVDAYYEMLCQICATKSKVILTSVVRQELNKMQFVKMDYKAKRARSIMAMAAEKPEKFLNVRIDESLETHDDCIVRYCAENKHRVTLLTADKNMALDAREQSIKVEFFRKGYKDFKSLQCVQSEIEKAGIRTLNPARKVEDRLLIFEMQGKKRDIRVWSGSQERVDGIVQLKVGDDVLIASKKVDSITFAHYQVINLDEKYNCKLIYSNRLYSYDQVDELPNGNYRSFARDFWGKFLGKR